MKIFKFAFIGALLTMAATASAETPPAPDNSKVNERDRDRNAITAESQSNASSDTELTRRIRRDLTSDKDLSVNAHNVKIITIKGKVTLRGPVNSENEKESVLKHAQAVVGASNVTNHLEVAKSN